MGGVNKGEGIVITKGRIGPVDLWKIDPSSGRCVYGPKLKKKITRCNLRLNNTWCFM